MLKREEAIKAVAAIEMGREGVPYCRTQEEFFADAAETVDAVLALLQPDEAARDQAEAERDAAVKNRQHYKAERDRMKAALEYARDLITVHGPVPEPISAALNPPKQEDGQ